MLVPNPPKIDVPLKMLLAKLSMNNSKSIADEGEEEKGRDGCSSKNGMVSS
jgi:hypothetical protein